MQLFPLECKEKCDLCDSNCGMDVDARWVDLSVLRNLI